jgi:hypothetical protein
LVDGRDVIFFDVIKTIDKNMMSTNVIVLPCVKISIKTKGAHDKGIRKRFFLLRISTPEHIQIRNKTIPS